MPLSADELIPDAAERERIYREACERVARERETWCSLDEAAAHIRCSRRQLYRLIHAYGVPVCKLTNTILRADLDALLRGHLDKSGAAVIAFPSLKSAA
jgi:AraC-like DNA-binding protein